jgi:hypothetical protein
MIMIVTIELLYIILLFFLGTVVTLEQKETEG